MHDLSLSTPPLGAIFLGAMMLLGFLASLTMLLVYILRGGRSKTRPGPLGSLFLSLGVLGLAGMALAVFLGTGAVLVGSAILKRSPVRSIEVVRTEHARAEQRSAVFDARFEPANGIPGDGSIEGEALRRYAGSPTGAAESDLDPRWPVHLLVTWRGRLAPERAERFRDWLEDATDGDVDLVETRPAPGQPEHVVLDFGLDVSRRELRELEEEFEEGQPFLELPEGVRLRIAD